MKSWGSGVGCFFGFLPWLIAAVIMAAMSRFDFVSTPPVANVRPSGLNATEVTVWPIVPADVAPIIFVIMAPISAMLGITIDPDFIAPGFMMAPGFIEPVGREPGLPSAPRLPKGDEVKSRIRVPD